MQTRRVGGVIQRSTLAEKNQKPFLPRFYHRTQTNLSLSRIFVAWCLLTIRSRVPNLRMSARQESVEGRITFPIHKKPFTNKHQKCTNCLLHCLRNFELINNNRKTSPQLQLHRRLTPECDPIPTRIYDGI
jgi:hypothetical protein